jgi:hypothetical protein
MCDIGDLHNTLSQTMYDDLLNIVLSKWKKDKELRLTFRIFRTSELQDFRTLSSE